MPTLWTAYRLGVTCAHGDRYGCAFPPRRLGRLLYLPARLAYCLSPVDYVRWREFGFVFAALDQYAPQAGRVLDLGSPKLLPTTIAASQLRTSVTSLDILPSEVRLAQEYGLRLGLANLTSLPGDVRRLALPDGSFDAVTSVSVLEHVAPEEDGDMQASREIARVLRPGGIAVLTMPFALRGFCEYRSADVYERKSLGGAPIFYQRFYDLQQLHRRIVSSSGLEALEIGYIDERFMGADPANRLALRINMTLRQRLVFGPFYHLFAMVFLSRPKQLEACVKAYIACLVLRKPVPALPAT